MARRKREIDWDVGEVKRWIKRCIDLGGTPTFRTRMFSQPIRLANGEKAVYAVCYTRMPGADIETLVIRHVPDDVYKFMETETGEWRLILYL